MPSCKLSKSSIGALPASAQDVIWWDTDLKGFGLKVTPAGRKVFLVQYRPTGDRRNPRKYTIGEFGPVKPLGDDYGEVSVAVSFESGIDRFVNFLAALTSEKALLATSEMRITSANPKEKTVNVRLTLSGVIPRKLVPEQKGSSLF